MCRGKERARRGCGSGSGAASLTEDTRQQDQPTHLTRGGGGQTFTTFIGVFTSVFLLVFTAHLLGFCT